MTVQTNPVPDASPGCTIINGRPHMTDAKGRLVPLDLVKPEDQIEDQMVRAVIGHAVDLSAQIARFRGHTFDDIGSFLAILAEKYQVSRGGQKGNMTFTTYDGCFKVQVQVSDTLTFGPSLQVAKDLIDECIREWSADSRAEIRALVEHAFQADKEGNVNREAIFRLRRVEIVDDRWQSAMAAITDSIRVAGSRTYVRFYKRDTSQGAWSPITIDLAAA